MNITAVSAVSPSAVVDSGNAKTFTPASPNDVSSQSDSQLMMLAAKGNTQAILELEKRDAARGARMATPDQTVTAANARALSNLELDTLDAARERSLIVPDQTVSPVTAGARAIELEKLDAAAQATRLQASAELATTLDARTLLELEQRNAAQAAKLLANANQNVSAFPPKAVGNMVDRFF